jgi:hypothetical protein
VVHPAALAAASLRARLGDAIPEMIEAVVARLGESVEHDPDPRRLLNAIVSDPVDEDLVAQLSAALGWVLPRRVAAIVLEVGVVPGDLPPDTLADWTSPEPVLVLPDPDAPGRAAALGRALRGCRAAIGLAVPLAQAAHSLRWAREALALARVGVLGDGVGPVRCEEHMSTLLLLADKDLASAMVRPRLAPLDRLRPGQRELIAATLLAWLELSMNTVAVARRMNVHPQTIRYRLKRIRQLFGDELGDPQRRFELMLALRIAVLFSLTTDG